MEAEDVRAFEAVAGELLSALGYELSAAGRRRSAVRETLALARYRLTLGAWNAQSPRRSARRSGAAATLRSRSAR